MPLVQALLDLTRKRVDIDNQIADTNLKNAHADVFKAQAEADAATKAALANFNAARLAATGERPDDAPPEGVDANAQMRDIQATIKDAQQRSMQFKATGDALLGANPKLADDFYTRANSAAMDAHNGQLRLLQERKSALERMAGAAGSASPETWPTVQKQLNRIAPGWDRKADVDIDPETGATTWGLKTQATMRQMQQAGLTANEQLSRAIDAKKLERDQAQLDLAQKEYERKLKKDAALEAQARAGLTQRQDEAADRKAAREQAAADRAAAAEAKKEEQDRKAIVNLDKTLNMQTDVAVLPKYETAWQRGKEVYDQLQKGGVSSINQASALALSQALLDMNNQFRARSGDKAAFGRLREMQGVLQRSVGFWEQIGRGGRVPDENTLRQQLQYVDQAYQIAQEQAAKATLRTQATAERRGLDPTLLQGRGDMDYLISQGRVFMGEINGKKVYFFGDPNDPKFRSTPENTFEVPSSPSENAKPDKRVTFNIKNAPLSEVRKAVEAAGRD